MVETCPTSTTMTTSSFGWFHVGDASAPQILTCGWLPKLRGKAAERIIRVAWSFLNSNEKKKKAWNVQKLDSLRQAKQDLRGFGVIMGHHHPLSCSLGILTSLVADHHWKLSHLWGWGSKVCGGHILSRHNHQNECEPNKRMNDIINTITVII